MDGFHAPEGAQRRTLKTRIGCVGIGVHTGRRVALEIHPAPAGTGILFRRTDLGIDIPARFDRVVDTRLCTALAAEGAPQARIGTVEHVMAALAGLGITDAVLMLDGPEVPILDGSAAPFVFLLDCAGTTGLGLPAPVIEVTRRIRVDEGEAFAELHPAATPGFEAHLDISYPGTVIGDQALGLRVTPAVFRGMLADSRTFGLAEDVSRLRAAGLAQGGSLQNAVVVDGPMVLNPGGLRHPNEFVRHKLLDVVGDMALAGAALSARFVGHRSGHALNNRLLRALFADRGAWRMVEPALAAEGVPSRMPAAAAPAVA